MTLQTLSDELQTLEPNRLSLKHFQVDSELDQDCWRIVSVANCEIAMAAKQSTYTFAARFSTGTACVIMVNTGVKRVMKNLAAEAFSVLICQKIFPILLRKFMSEQNSGKPFLFLILFAVVLFSKLVLSLRGIVIALFAARGQSAFFSFGGSELISRFNETAIAATLFGYVNGVATSSFVTAHFANILASIMFGFVWTECLKWLEFFTRATTLFGNHSRIGHVGLPVGSAIPPACSSRCGGLTHSMKCVDSRSSDVSNGHAVGVSRESLRLTCFKGVI